MTTMWLCPYLNYPNANVLFLHRDLSINAQTIVCFDLNFWGKCPSDMFSTIINLNMCPLSGWCHYVRSSRWAHEFMCNLLAFFSDLVATNVIKLTSCFNPCLFMFTCHCLVLILTCYGSNAIFWLLHYQRGNTLQFDKGCRHNRDTGFYDKSYTLFHYQ